MGILRTNYKDDIFSNLRKYRLLNNSDGTISLEDVTAYTQEGDRFGAVEVNEITAEINAKSPLVSPAFTSKPTAPTAAKGTNTTQIATTAFVLENSGIAAYLCTGANDDVAIQNIINNFFKSGAAKTAELKVMGNMGTQLNPATSHINLNSTNARGATFHLNFENCNISDINSAKPFIDIIGAARIYITGLNLVTNGSGISIDGMSVNQKVFIRNSTIKSNNYGISAVSLSENTVVSIEHCFIKGSYGDILMSGNAAGLGQWTIVDNSFSKQGILLGGSNYSAWQVNSNVYMPQYSNRFYQTF